MFYRLNRQTGPVWKRWENMAPGERYLAWEPYIEREVRKIKRAPDITRGLIMELTQHDLMVARNACLIAAEERKKEAATKRAAPYLSALQFEIRSYEALAARLSEELQE